jgi:hypothetical protein
MRRRSRLLIAVPALATLLSACGGAAGSSDYPDGGNQGGDAGAAYCRMELSLTASEASVPTILEASATIESQLLAGQQRFSWDVYLADGTPVPYTPQTPDEQRITIEATTPGVYRVDLAGAMGGTPCAPTGESVTLAPAGAVMIPYRLRFVPAPGQPAVIHERTESIITGIDNDLGRITLPGGIPIAGEIRTAAGAPVAAYVRATRSDAAPVETFADAAGAFSMRLDSARYDVLVVPGDGAALAPARFPAQPISTAWTLTLPPARLATGTALDPAGQPLAGARVALQIDGAPAAVAITDAQGAFAVPVSPGSAAALLVVPPVETGLPWLALDDSPALAAALAAGTPLAIAYDAALRVHTVAPVARDAGGASLAGVRATWIARSIAAPGTLTTGQDPLTLPLTGATRVTATAGQDGTWPALRLPAAAYDVVLEPAADTAAGGVTVVPVNVDGETSVDALALTQPALVRGRVVDAGGDGLARTQVTATPRGLLAASPAAGAVALTAGNGTFVLTLAPGAEYELAIDSATRQHGRTRVSVTAPPAGQSIDLAPVALSPAVRVSGDVAITSGAGAAGVTVLLTCLDCDFAAPLAEAVTDGTGAFVLAVPVVPSVIAPAP